MGKRIVVIGGTGTIGRLTVKQLLALSGEYQIVLAARNEEEVQKVAESLSSALTTRHVEIFNKAELQEVIRGADLVLNATGPLKKTGLPVLEACIAEKVNYTDYGDTCGTCEAMLACHDRVKEAGITALICGGVSPGLLGVIATKYMAMMKAETLEFAWILCWCSGKKRAKEVRIPHVELLLLRITGTCPILKDGRKIEMPAFRQGKVFYMPEPIGPYTCYALEHSEVCTFSHFYPHLKNISGHWGVFPPYLAGFLQGIARAIEKGQLKFKDAVDFIAAFAAGQKPQSNRPYLSGLRGVFRQFFQGGMKTRDFLDFWKLALTGKFPTEGMGGVIVSVEGEYEGRRARISYRELETEDAMDEDEMTASAMAAFIHLFLAGKIQGKGVKSAESSTDPNEFFHIVEKLGAVGIYQRVNNPEIEYL